MLSQDAPKGGFCENLEKMRIFCEIWIKVVAKWKEMEYIGI
jgi:hypothetical protein